MFQLYGTQLNVFGQQRGARKRCTLESGLLVVGANGVLHLIHVQNSLSFIAGEEDGSTHEYEQCGKNVWQQCMEEGHANVQANVQENASCYSLLL